MKTNKLFLSLLLTATTVGLFTSCNSADEKQADVEISTGLFVLNSGGYQKNNASLTYYNFADSTTTVDAFTAKNNRGLGDTGQDILIYGSKIYISVYDSKLIEVLDAATGISLKSIILLNESGTARSPRSLASYNGKIYVSLYDGHVSQIDTATLSVEKTITVGANPDGMAIAGNKLYVANSGVMATVNDSTVSVINLTSFSEEKKIKVIIDPTIVKTDSYGDVYVISNGNYGDIPYTLQRIEAGTGKVTPISVDSNFIPVNFTIVGDYAYIYSIVYKNGVFDNKSYSIYDVKNETMYKRNFISSDPITLTPYCIDVDPATNYVYIGETDYVNTGKMYCFDQNGILKYTFPTGVNPIKTVFVTKK